jgi:hypothetical protein
MREARVGGILPFAPGAGRRGGGRDSRRARVSAKVGFIPAYSQITARGWRWPR